MTTTPGIPERALDTHKDATEDVKLRVLACEVAVPGIMSLAELKMQARDYAARGFDPIDAGIVELGLMLPTEDYEALKSYARSLDVKYPKRRRAA